MFSEKGRLVPLSEAEWWGALKQAPDATFFSSPEWASIAARQLQGKPGAWLLSVRDDSYLVTGVITKGRLGFHHVVAMPFSTYPGVLPLGAAPRDTVRVLEVLHSSFPRIVRIGTLRVVFGIGWSDAPGVSKEMTNCVDLEAGLDAVGSGLHQGPTRHLRQAAKYGVRARTMTDLEGFRNLYRLTEASLAAWGRETTPYPWTVFADIARAAAASNQSLGVQLWEAHLEGVPLAYALVFYGYQEAFYWAGAMDRSLSRYRGATFLQWAIIEDACQRGLKRYNMGASGSLEGVRTFKERFGAAEITYPFAEVEFAAFRLLRRVWHLGRFGR